MTMSPSSFFRIHFLLFSVAATGAALELWQGVINHATWFGIDPEGPAVMATGLLGIIVVSKLILTNVEKQKLR